MKSTVHAGITTNKNGNIKTLDTILLGDNVIAAIGSGLSNDWKRTITLIFFPISLSIHPIVYSLQI